MRESIELSICTNFSIWWSFSSKCPSLQKSRLKASGKPSTWLPPVGPRSKLAQKMQKILSNSFKVASYIHSSHSKLSWSRQKKMFRLELSDSFGQIETSISKIWVMKVWSKTNGQTIKIFKKHVPRSQILDAGGKPSTWFPPGRLVEHIYSICAILGTLLQQKSRERCEALSVTHLKFQLFIKFVIF